MPMALTATAPRWLRILQYLMGLSVIAALAVTGSWVAFGPGGRHFTMSGFGVSGGTDDIFGRIMFGFGTILTWGLFVLIALRGAKQFRRRDSGA
jgi:hypothetical protein